MKKIFIIALFSILNICITFAQKQAFVVELHNGLADIYAVTPELKIKNAIDIDSLVITQNDKNIASYSRSDVKRIYFDDEQILTDSVERAAFIALYNATNGPNWQYQTNWCSDKPISEWEGIDISQDYFSFDHYADKNMIGELPIEITNLKRFNRIALYSNKLYGQIPATIGRLSNLTELNLGSNKLSGSIPPSIVKLSNLQYLDLYNNALSGEIPKNISKLSNLRKITLWSNKIEGSLPEELLKLPYLEELNLRYNKLSGQIPDVFPRNNKLTFVSLCGNNFTGPIPSSIGNLKSVKNLNLSMNNLSGQIPECIGYLTSLEELSLWKNNLEGEIPSSFENLKKLIASRPDGSKYFNLDSYYNNLSGKVPSLFLNSEGWQNEWAKIISHNNYSLDDFYITAPSFHVYDVEGNIQDSRTIYQTNTYTALFHWRTDCGYAISFLQLVKDLYKKYKKKGLEIIGFSEQKDTKTFIDYIANEDIQWSNFISTKDNMLDYTYSCVGTGCGYPEGGTPEISLVDFSGRVVFSSAISPYRDVANFLEEHLGNGDEAYTSKDYSQDGKVYQLKNATKGKGINLVLMGEGYTDKDIEEGKYLSGMQNAIKELFEEQPMKELKEYFNVYTVIAVSPNGSYFDGSKHAFEENDSKIFEYARKAIGESPERIMVGIIYNDVLKGANERSYTRMWLSDGSFISYIKGIDEGLLCHEIVGHGLAQLLDEYIEPGNEGKTIPEGKKNYLEEVWKEYGVGANVDCCNDPSEVKWAHFLADDRYNLEQLGIYEGGYLYSKGCYRPTEKSLMRCNDIHFNAPSRESIYKHIMKYADPTWQYNREEFIEFDLSTFKPTESKSRQTNKIKESDNTGIKERIMGLPPKIIKGTWKNH